MVENVFGIAASRFRILYRPIVASVEKVKQITKAVVVLHNFLMTENHNNDNCPPSMIDNYGPNGIIEGDWQRETQSITGMVPLGNRISSNNYCQDAKKVRDGFKDYFNNEGSVE